MKSQNYIHIGNILPPDVWVSIYPKWKYNLITKESSLISKEDSNLVYLDLSTYFENSVVPEKQTNFLTELQADIAELKEMARRITIIDKIYFEIKKEALEHPISKEEIEAKLIEALSTNKMENNSGRNH